MSLRKLHLIVILSAIIGADCFGAWAVWRYREVHDVGILCLGIAAVVGGLGLIWYAIRLVNAFEKAHIE